MRKIAFTALALASLSLHANQYCCLNSRFHILGDYTYSRRTQIRNLRLVEKEIGPDDFKKVIKTEDLVDRFKWKTGLRGSLFLVANRCSSLEVLYNYTYPWKGQKTVFGNENLSVPFEDPFFTFDYIDADSASAIYTSELQNGEFNYWGHEEPRRREYFSAAWNIGFRYIFLDERFKLSVTNGPDRSDYRIRTKNFLYGLQLGCFLDINPTCHWTWTFMVKGVGFLNDAHNEDLLKDLDNTLVLRKYKKQRFRDSWLLEGTGQLAYNLGSWLSIHVGYQGFIVTGLALAPEQRNFTSSMKKRISNSGQIVIDGAFAGATISF